MLQRLLYVGWEAGRPCKPYSLSAPSGGPAASSKSRERSRRPPSHPHLSSKSTHTPLGLAHQLLCKYTYLHLIHIALYYIKYCNICIIILLYPIYYYYTTRTVHIPIHIIYTLLYTCIVLFNVLLYGIL